MAKVKRVNNEKVFLAYLEFVKLMEITNIETYIEDIMAYDNQEDLEDTYKEGASHNKYYTSEVIPHVYDSLIKYFYNIAHIESKGKPLPKETIDRYNELVVKAKSIQRLDARVTFKLLKEYRD